MTTDIRRTNRADLAAIVAGLADRTEAQHAHRLLLQEQGHGVYLIAWIEGRPVGHVMLKWPSWPERHVSEFTARYDCSWVEDLAVQPQSRNQGVGKRVMETLEALTLAEGIRRVGLDVGLDVGYAAARHLYDSLGYRDRGHGQFISSARVEGGGLWMEWLVFLLKEL
jgi:GNAT superfamily N-acetyltransferase